MIQGLVIFGIRLLKDTDLVLLMHLLLFLMDKFIMNLFLVMNNLKFVFRNQELNTRKDMKYKMEKTLKIINIYGE